MKIEHAVLMKALDWSYDKALAGGGPFVSAYDLAGEYLAKNGSHLGAVNSLVNAAVAKCATSGFVTGLGGIITLPVAIPANISSVLLIQLRMILTIAVIGGFDVRSEGVRSLAFICLTGSASTGILKELGLTAGERVTERALQNITSKVATRINYQVKLRLLAKTGRIGILKLGKVLPLVGGLIGGTIDASSTKLVGSAAKKIFLAAG